MKRYILAKTKKGGVYCLVTNFEIADFPNYCYVLFNIDSIISLVEKYKVNIFDFYTVFPDQSEATDYYISQFINKNDIRILREVLIFKIFIKNEKKVRLHYFEKFIEKPKKREKNGLTN